MKNPNIILLFLMVLAWTGCHKDKEINVKEAVVSNEEVTVSETQARFSWQVDFAGQFQTGVELSQNENMSDLRRVEAAKVEDRFQALADGLLEGTKYYYRIVVWNKFSSSEQPVGHFTTLETPLDTTFYTVTVSCLPEEGGLVSGGGTFAEGDTSTVVATANAGYNFVNWTENENQISTDSVYTFAVTGDHVLVANFTQQEYTITAAADPEEGGMVSGSGGYNHGDECTLTATANEGYNFVNWTKDGTEVSTHLSYTFTVTETATYVAHFQLQSFTVTVAANPASGGNVEGGGIFEYGQSCTVRATNANGYNFVNWTENGGQVSSNAEYTFTVTGNRDLVAHFTSQEYIVTATADPEAGGTVSGSGGYNHGEECTLTATANEGYDFVNWTKDGTEVSTHLSYTFTVTETATYVAHFQIKSYTIGVSANPSNGGTVTGGGTYSYGQNCTVKATANSNYQFTNWTENDSVVSNDATYSFNVTNDRNLVANFTYVPPTPTYTISVSANPANGGTVTGGGTYQQGQSCTVTATAKPNYSFVNWMEGSQVVSTESEYSFTVTSNRTLVAHFEALPCIITVTANPTNGGSVTGGGTYQEGEICTVLATANAGYTFTNWTENGNVVSNSASYMFQVTGSRHLVANFTQQQYTISVSASPSNGGSAHVGSTTGPSSGTYNQGESCTVYATAATGYHFVRWTENGNQVSTSANYTFTVTGSRTLVAQFQINTYTISVSANPSIGGTVNGGGTYNYGQSCTLTATPSSGYSFINWTKNGQQVSTNANYSFTVTETATYVANFQSTVPQGAINGKFTINSSGDKVYFSQGNLQYIGSASTPYWKFADNQWDVLGTTTGQNSASQNVDRDLFGWGTSGYNHGAVCYQPWSTSQTTSDYYAYGQFTYNLYDQDGRADWGYNAISNGGGQENNGWRTLTGHTGGEWNYIFNQRNASTVNGIPNARYAKAKVSNVQGVILFPDTYIHPSGVAQPVGINETGNTGWNGNNYSAADFESMEDNGAVFLPAAGYRYGTSVDLVGSYGNYWSASYSNSSSAFDVSFGDSGLNPQSSYHRCSGQSVRLVRVAQ